MPLSREQKQHFVDELKSWISEKALIVFADHKGLGAEEARMLRRSIREANAVVRVIKKTLTKLALKRSHFEIPDGFLGEEGAVIVVRDPNNLAPLNAAYKFQKAHGAFKIVGGIFRDKLVPREEIIALAELPSEPELRAKLLGVLSAPLYGFVNVLVAPTRNFVSILSQIKK